MQSGSAQHRLTRVQDSCRLNIDNVNAILCYPKLSTEFKAREHVRANTQTEMVLRSINIESQSDLCVPPPARLALLQAKVNGAFSNPAPREFMIELARAKNAVPLPLIRPGVHLPPPEHCNELTSRHLTGASPRDRGGRGYRYFTESRESGVGEEKVYSRS